MHQSPITNHQSPLTLGFSPCPNDTFIFDAMVHGKVDTEGLSFELLLEDVEALNQRAMKEELDITKLSFAAYPFAAKEYVLLDAGSALGNNCGPILITNHQSSITNHQSSITNSKIAIPGKYTTANFLLSLFFPDAKNKEEMLFSEIEDAVVKGTVDAGVIIHENRFTYEQKGLKKIADLGEMWESETKIPIPLGGIAVKRSIPLEVQQKINRVLKRSVKFAFANPKASVEFVCKNAQSMKEEVMYKHIDLYVNKFSVNLGEEGKAAIHLLFSKATEMGIIPEIKSSIFVNP